MGQRGHYHIGVTPQKWYLTNRKKPHTIILVMKKITALSLSTIFYLTLALPAFAATAINPCPTTGNSGGVGFFNLCGISPSGAFLGSIITLLFVIALLIAFAFLIFGGIKWILSGGEKTKVEEARGTIVAALVGLVVVFLAFFIINFLLGVFKLKDIQNLTIPTINP